MIFFDKSMNELCKINQTNKKWSFQSVVIEWLHPVLKGGESGEGTELWPKSHILSKKKITK